MAKIEPSGRRVQDAFQVVDYSTEFQVLWNHKSDLQQTLRTEADTNAIPKPGKEAYAHSLWAKKSRLLIAGRVDTINVRTASVVLDLPVLGSAWIPINSMKIDARVHPAWCMWLNSSWSIVQLLAMRSKKLTYPHFNLEQLRSIKLPDPNLVDLDLLSSQFEKLKCDTLKPWSEIDTDSVRKEIDETCADAMNFDKREAEEIRIAIAQEPTVGGI